MRLNIAIFEAFTKRKLVIYSNVSIKNTPLQNPHFLSQKLCIFLNKNPDFGFTVNRLFFSKFYDFLGKGRKLSRDYRVAKNDTN